MPRKRPERPIAIDPLQSSQEPFVRIIAPNLDRISRDSFRRGSVERRSIIRGLIIFGIVIALVIVVAVLGFLSVALR
jgi:hypothetical protein